MSVYYLKLLIILFINLQYAKISFWFLIINRKYPDLYQEDADIEDQLNLEEIVKGYVFFMGSSYFLSHCFDEEGELNPKFNCPTSNLYEFIKYVSY